MITIFKTHVPSMKFNTKTIEIYALIVYSVSKKYY